jgi:hypothetical protein
MFMPKTCSAERRVGLENGSELKNLPYRDSVWMLSASVEDYLTGLIRRSYIRSATESGRDELADLEQQLDDAVGRRERVRKLEQSSTRS